MWWRCRHAHAAIPSLGCPNAAPVAALPALARHPPRGQSAGAQWHNLCHPPWLAVARCAYRLRSAQDALQPLSGGGRMGVFDRVFAALAAEGGPPDRLRSFSSTRKPLFLGIIMSRMMRSGFSRSATIRPELPSRATRMRKPRFSRIVRIDSTISWSSSTSKIVRSGGFMALLSRPCGRARESSIDARNLSLPPVRGAGKGPQWRGGP